MNGQWAFSARPETSCTRPPGRPLAPVSSRQAARAPALAPAPAPGSCVGAGQGLVGVRTGGHREEGGRGWEPGRGSVNGPRGPREQEEAPAKALTEKRLSKQRWPGRWTPSTIVRGADPGPQARDSLLPAAPPPFRREVIFSMGSAASRGLSLHRVALQNPLGLTPGPP